MSRFAIPIAIVVGVASIIGTFLLLRNFYWDALPAIIIALILGGCISYGAYRILDLRTEQDVESDSYEIEARALGHTILREIEHMSSQIAEIEDTQMGTLLEDLRTNVEDYMKRVHQDTPNQLLVYTRELKGFVDSIAPFIPQYVDIEKKPHLYTNPAKQQEETRKDIRILNNDLVQRMREGIESNSLVLYADRQALRAIEYKRITSEREDA